MVPGSSLRSYLEGRTSLTLPVLRQILRAHYREQDATELFHRLSRLAQDGREPAQSFLVRAMDLRQSGDASQETGSGLKYDPALVQSMFIHALLTGLRGDAVKAELRPYLQSTSITDEELFTKLNLAASQEAERQEKLGISKRPTAEVRQVMQSDHQSQPATSKRPPRQGTLITDIAELKAGITEIANALRGVQVLPSHQPAKPKPMATSWKRGCQSCQRNGSGDTCDHRYKCGSSEHYARGCRRGRYPQSGNAQGLLQRDGQ